MSWTVPEAFQELPSEVAAELVGQLIETFQADSDVRLQRVRSAIAGANLHMLRAEVHSMKGSASQMGADAMASVCLEMESAIGQVSASRLLESVAKLESHLESALRAMREYRP